MERVTLVGIGSLMAKSSAENSFRVENFRAAVLEGWERVFNLVGVNSLRNRRADPDKWELAALAARRREGAEMMVSVFDIPEEDLPAFYEREQRYVIEKVVFREAGGDTGEGLLCVQNTTENYKATTCNNDPSLYHHHVGQYWSGPLWYNFTSTPPALDPPTIYPMRKYLALCRYGAADLGVETNFLATTFTHDGRTLVQYLQDNPDIDSETKPGVPITFMIGKYKSPEDAAHAAAAASRNAQP